MKLEPVRVVLMVLWTVVVTLLVWSQRMMQDASGLVVAGLIWAGGMWVWTKAGGE
jgi:hypothetical protein